MGTSGSAKSIRDVIAAEYGDDEEMTYAGMQKIAARIIEAGSTKKARFEGLKPDRIEVFAGGLAVMMAAFEELDIKKMYGYRCCFARRRVLTILSAASLTKTCATKPPRNFSSAIMSASTKPAAWPTPPANLWKAFAWRTTRRCRNWLIGSNM